MKNVLLATTALVAMAGAASADIAFSGKADVNYNTVRTTALNYSLSVKMSATAALNNGVTAGADYGLKLDQTMTAPTFNTLPVIWFESSVGKLSAGDAKAVGAASSHYSKTKGNRGFGTGSYLASNAAVRADVNVGGFAISVSETATGGSDLRAGVSGSFGAVDFGLGYAQATNAFGLNVGTTVAGADLKASYYTAAGVGSFGVEAKYAMSNGLTLGAYYASVTPTANWGVSVDYASGAFSGGVTYNQAGAVGVNVGYDMGNGAKLSAGYDSGDREYYVGAEYDLGNGAKVYGSYGSTDNSTPADGKGYKKPTGITIGASMTF